MDDVDIRNRIVSTTSHRSTSTHWRIAAAVAVVLLSLIVPAIIVGFSIRSALAGKLFGRPSREQKIYQGAIKDGELWFHAGRNLENAAPPLDYEGRLIRLDLETGEEHETGISLVGDSLFTMRINDELYSPGIHAIYRVTDGILEKVAARPEYSQTFDSTPFLDNGRLSFVVMTKDAGYRLVHWSGDHWDPGREVLMPGRGRVCYHDAEHDREALLPLTSEQPSSTKSLSNELTIIQAAGQTHLFHSDYYVTGFYRNGFEYADEIDDACSALVPANFLHEVSGWVPIGAREVVPRLIMMTCDKDGLIFPSWGRPRRAVRRTIDGQWAEITGMETKPGFTPWIVAYPTEACSYVIKENQRWHSATIHRLEGNTVQPAHVILRGCQAEYIARWKRLGSGFLLAWLSHLALILAGTAWCIRATDSDYYGFGAQQANLASLTRRTMACLFDMILLVTLFISGMLVWMQTSGVTIPWNAWTESDVCEWLFGHEHELDEGLRKKDVFPACKKILQSFVPPSLRETYQPLLILGIAQATILCGLLALLEGRTGCTLGEWLLGIRTTQTTLRPCGTIRAIVRGTLFFMIDVPFLLTPLPAAISMMFSAQRQRLGDRAADTMVINSGSICSISNRDRP